MERKVIQLVLISVAAMLCLSLISIVVYASASWSASHPDQVKCPVDGSGAHLTGNTKVDISGKLLWEYKCYEFAHSFWVVKQ